MFSPEERKAAALMSLETGKRQGHPCCRLQPEEDCLARRSVDGGGRQELQDHVKRWSQGRQVSQDGDAPHQSFLNI